MGDTIVNRSNRRRQWPVPLRSAPPTSSVVNIQMSMDIHDVNTAYAALPSSFAIRTRRYGGAVSVPLGRVAGYVHGVAVRFCSPCDPVRCCATVSVCDARNDPRGAMEDQLAATNADGLHESGTVSNRGYIDA
eukprot:5838780-Pleurochrysis_carterae.AAC.1